jgi:hypothetical protein
METRATHNQACREGSVVLEEIGKIERIAGIAGIAEAQGKVVMKVREKRREQTRKTRRESTMTMCYLV